MGSEQHYSLRWNDYTLKIVSAFQSLRDEEDFVDVTVACDGHSYSAHKMVLSACSPYFRALLRANPCQHPIVILKDVGHTELERLLEFMYNGEVSIAQDQLAAFLKTAENLKIRGLAGSSDEMDQAGVHRPDVSYSYSSSLVGGGVASGRSSPSVSYAPSQGSKDDDLVVEGNGNYHARPDSPPTKKRKRSRAPAASHADSNTSSHTTEGVASDGAVEVDAAGVVGGGLPGDDDHIQLDRRELKSEPAIPGPSGAVGGPDSVGTHEGGAAPGGAVCEALNLSLRPPLPQTNGTLHQPLLHHHHHHHHQPQQQPQQQQQPPHLHQHHQQLQHHHHHHHLQHHQPQQQQQQQQQQELQTAAPSTAINHVVSTDCNETYEVKVHPVVAVAAASGLYADDALDLAPEKVSGLMTVGEIKEDRSMMEPSPEYKVKLYPCPECHKVFRHPMSLHHHRHVHKGTYTCHSCGKVFSRRWDLHRHLHRSKMGCRRPNHVTTAPALVTSAPGVVTTSTTAAATAAAVAHRAEFALDLNNPPSN